MQQKQAKTGSKADSSAPTSETTSRLQSGGGAGKPLPKSVRAFFEPRFGRDLGDVRIHEGAAAGRMNRQFDALALTYGRDIYFRPETYAPHTHSGKHLLAHELTHVVQQTGRAGGGVGVDGSRESFSPTPSPQVQRVGLVDVGHYPMNPALREERERFHRAKFSSTYDQYTVAERIEMIQDLLDQWWVGPQDESALEEIWASFGSRLVEIANQHLDLWNQSWQRGAELTMLAPVQQFLVEFRQRALTETQAVLEESRTRLIAEQIRYGLRSVTTEHQEVRDVPTGDLIGGRSMMVPQEVTVRRRHVEMAASPTTAGLAAAAESLADQQRHIRELKREQLSLVNHTYAGAPMGMPAVMLSRPMITDRRKYKELGKQIETAKEEKQALEETFTQQYPILAAVSDNLAALDKIAEGPSRDAAARLEEEITERLENIEKVKEELGPEGDLSIWGLPRMMDQTKQQMGIEAGSLQASMIDAKVDAVETDKTLRDLALGTIAVGLGLLAAVPTGGSSLLVATAAVGATGSAAIGVYQAGEHYQRYQAEAAAVNTAFDRARAISQDEPSLFWLALDIVFAGLDLHAARVVFNIVGPAVKQAIRSGKELSQEALDTARRLGGPELVQRVVQRVERFGGSRRVRQALTRHDEAVEAAGRRLGAEAVAEVPTRLGAHHVKLTPGGRLVRCSAVCDLVRSAYATELAKNDTLARRLSQLEAQLLDVDPRSPVAGSLLEEARDLVDRLDAVRRTERLTAEITAELPGALDSVPRSVLEDLVADLGEDVVDDLLEAAQMYAPSAGNLAQATSDMFDLAHQLRHIEGIEEVFEDLISFSVTTARGTEFELRWLLQNKSRVSRVAIPRVTQSGVKKGADVLLHNNTMVELKNYNLTSWFYQNLPEVTAQNLGNQVKRRLQEGYTNILIVFSSDAGQLPTSLKTALRNQLDEIALQRGIDPSSFQFKEWP